MTTLELRDKLLRELWSPTSTSTPSYVHEDIAIAVNRALQEIWTAPNAEYVRRRKATFNTSSGTESYTLGTSLIAITGPVYANHAQLSPMTNKGDFRALTARFLQADPTAASGESLFYYLERLNIDNDTADPVQVNMLLAPTPGSTFTVNYEAAFEPPNLSKCDLDDNVTIPVPHGWLETIVLPLAQYWLMDSHWYSKNQRTDSTQAITAGYMAARRQLGLADPQISTVTQTRKQPLAATS